MENVLNNFILVGSLILLGSVILSKSSHKFGLPILVVFLFLGMLSGSEGLGGIYFENYELTHSLSLIALCLIIFSGGIDTKIDEIRENFGRGVALSSLGIIFTTGLVGGFAYYVMKLSLVEALLLGAILSATDAAAVFSAFKDKSTHIQPQVKSLLKFESGSNDPMAYFLVSVLLGFEEYGGNDLVETGISFILNPLTGFICGWLISKAFIYINNIINLDYLGLYPALTLSFLFLSYSLPTQIGGNGFLSVYVFGVLISSQKILHKTLLYSFYDGISWISQIGLFVMLGLLVFPSRLTNVTFEGLVIACFLILIARPLTVFICLLKSKFTSKEKVLISLGGLKGATPIVFASFAATRMGDRSDLLFDIVFFVVLISALAQGALLKPAARYLGLLVEGDDDSNFPIDFEMLEKTKHGISEFRLTAQDFAVGRRVIDLSLPSGALVIFIKRSGSFIIPDGSTLFEKGDKVLIATKEKHEVDFAIRCFQKDMFNASLQIEEVGEEVIL